ncbi:MAG TPA: amidohydrolase family protein [Nitrosopumilaceae archaeon]|nr:amidohydrolase family protein [Nitrosopumilaceae archaeon]
MLIKNASVLYGNELNYIQNTNIRISDNLFSKIGTNLKPLTKEETHDCEGLLMIPGFINAHTHIGDSIAKDIGIDYGIEEKIHPVMGFKHKILKNTESSHLTSFMRNSCISMMKKGITTFIDFREGGLDGILILKKAISNLPIRSIILGRIDYYQNTSSIKKNIPLSASKKKELTKLLEKCDGVGISGPNENSNSVLRHYSQTKKIKAIHAAETIGSCEISKKSTGKTETERAMILKPNFLVHMTHASKHDLVLAAQNKISIVVCPRANASLADGIPNVHLMMKAGCNLAIGTDNVMINSPDMFREMDYLWKISMGMQKTRLSPKSILKMASVNVSKMLKNKQLGTISPQSFADCIFIDKHAIDLEPMHNPHASIVHRASESTIKAVMIGGRIVHGKI